MVADVDRADFALQEKWGQRPERPHGTSGLGQCSATPSGPSAERLALPAEYDRRVGFGKWRVTAQWVVIP